jgi:hypothetical protein
MVESCQALITRLPYAESYDAKPVLEAAKRVDERGLICVSVPIHTDAPEGPWRFLGEALAGGLKLVSVVSWVRDRLIVVMRSKRLTNAWEPIFIFSKADDYILDRDAAMKVKKGLEGREGAFDEDEFKTCVGDHWPIRNDRRDRRFLPAQVTVNCGQLSGLQPGDRVLDLHFNPSIKEACELVGWTHVDGGLSSAIRGKK